MYIFNKNILGPISAPLLGIFKIVILKLFTKSTFPLVYVKITSKKGLLNYLYILQIFH